MAARVTAGGVSTITAPRPLRSSPALPIVERTFAPTGEITQRQLLVIVVAIGASAIGWNPWGLSPFVSLRLVTAPLVVGAGCVVALRHGLRPTRAMTASGAAVLAVAVGSAVASGSPAIAVFGSPGRHAGLLALATVLGAGFLGAAVGATSGGRERVVAMSVVAGSAGAAIALLQLVGLELPGLHELGGSGRATGVSGSAAQLGAFLALCLPISAWRMLRAPSRPIAAALALQTAALLASQARASWLAALVGLVLVALAESDRVRRHRRVATSVVGLVVAAVAVIPSLQDRVTSIVGGTMRGRWIGWAAAVRAIGSNPILGAGPDQTRAVLPGALPRSYESIYGGAEILDRAHNVVLDQLLWTGLLGLVAFVGLGIVWWRLTRSVRREPAVVALLAGGAAFGVHLLLNFPMPELDVTVWFVLGAAGGASLLGSGAGGVRRSWAVVVLAIVIVIVGFGVRNLLADARARDAVDAERRGDVAVAIDGYRAASAAAPEQLVYREMYARVLLRTSSAGVAAAGGRVRALGPGDPFSIELGLRTSVLEAYATGDTVRAQAVLEAYDDLVGEVPSRVQFRVGLGLAQLAAGDAEGALDTIAEASAATPADAGILRTLAMVEDLLGRTDAARRHRSLADCLTGASRPGTTTFVPSANRLEVCGS